MSIAAATGQRFAFVDVDHSLLRVSTLHDFASFYFSPAERHEPHPKLVEHARTLERMAATGADRTAMNRRYYELWADEPVTSVRAAANDWHAARASAHDFYRRPVVELVEALRAQGSEIVLLSGSFDECLDPIARRVGASAVLCTALTRRAERYTGAVERPMIGEHKAAAVRDFVAGVPQHELAEDTAIGDHLSDVPVLELVGHPVVVPVDEGLVDLARTRNWRLAEL
jgi:HAD superfamily hydrolase (TIGR01490 family)